MSAVFFFFFEGHEMPEIDSKDDNIVSNANGTQNLLRGHKII